MKRDKKLVSFCVGQVIQSCIGPLTLGRHRVESGRHKSMGWMHLITIDTLIINLLSKVIIIYIKCIR